MKYVLTAIILEWQRIAADGIKIPCSIVFNACEIERLSEYIQERLDEGIDSKSMTLSPLIKEVEDK